MKNKEPHTKPTRIFTIAFLLILFLLTVFPMTKASFDIPSNVPPSYYYSDYSTLFENQDLLQYPSVYDGYLWIVRSNPWPMLLKCNLMTQENISQVALPYVTTLAEYFQAFVHKGLVFVPGEDGQTDISNGQLVILNEQTLAIESTYVIPSSAANFIVSATYDKESDNLLFGLDTTDGSVSILAVPASQATNSSAYRVIQVDNVSSAESQIITFNSTVYVLATYPSGGLAGTVHTNLYESKDLSNWTKILGKTGVNTNPGAYFAHLTASSDYLAIGLISDENTGVTTYRIDYVNKTGFWKEYDSFLNETSGEDHPSVNALSNDLFLWEPCARFRSIAHTLSVFNVTSGEMTYLFSPTGSQGYNDRWIGVDVGNNVLYIADCYAPNGGSQIIKVNWNTPLQVSDVSPFAHKIYIMQEHAITKPAGVAFANPGENLTVEYSPDPGYTINDVQINGSSVPIEGTYEFVNIDNNYIFSIHTDASPVSYFTIEGIPSLITAGTVLNSTRVTAFDSKNTKIETYNGTVYFTTSDVKGLFPCNSTNKYTFTESDKGSHTFPGIIFKTTGTQTITVTDGAVSSGYLPITIKPSLINRTSISPANVIITAGGKVTYKSVSWDIYNNLIGVTTVSTHWNISDCAGGQWSSNVYTSEKAGTWTVTATISGIENTTSLTVEVAPTPTPSNDLEEPTPSPVAYPSSLVGLPTIDSFNMVLAILTLCIVLSITTSIIIKKRHSVKLKNL